jgi:hypothetical protein
MQRGRHGKTSVSSPEVCFSAPESGCRRSRYDVTPAECQSVHMHLEVTFMTSVLTPGMKCVGGANEH